jgi:hypothetical protein
MVLTSVKSGIVERLGLGNEAGYHQIETLGDAFGALKSGGSRLKQRMIAGSIISGLLIMLFVAVSNMTIAHPLAHADSSHHSSLLTPRRLHSDKSHLTSGGRLVMMEAMLPLRKPHGQRYKTRKRHAMPSQKQSKSPSGNTFALTMKSTLLSCTLWPRNPTST